MLKSELPFNSDMRVYNLCPNSHSPYLETMGSRIQRIHKPWDRIRRICKHWGRIQRIPKPCGRIHRIRT